MKNQVSPLNTISRRMKYSCLFLSLTKLLFQSLFLAVVTILFIIFATPWLNIGNRPISQLLTSGGFRDCIIVYVTVSVKMGLHLFAEVLYPMSATYSTFLPRIGLILSILLPSVFLLHFGDSEPRIITSFLSMGYDIQGFNSLKIIIMSYLELLLAVLVSLFRIGVTSNIIQTTKVYLQGSGETALGIINDFLTYDKIDAGILKLELETVLFWDLVEATVRPFFLQARLKNINLILKDHIKGIHLRSISQQQQYGSGGMAALPADVAKGFISSSSSSSSTASSSELSVIQLSVEDQGPGIERKMAIEHGGKLSVFSDGLGCGSTFSLDLPVLLADSQRHEISATTSQKSNTMTGSTKLTMSNFRQTGIQSLSRKIGSVTPSPTNTLLSITADLYSLAGSYSKKEVSGPIPVPMSSSKEKPALIRTGSLVTSNIAISALNSNDEYDFNRINSSSSTSTSTSRSRVTIRCQNLAVIFDEVHFNSVRSLEIVGDIEVKSYSLLFYYPVLRKAILL
eukprot:gene2123-4146_t